MVLNTSESRVNVLLRLVGLVFIGLGATMTYLTYAEAAQSNLVPQIVPMFYLIGALLIIFGFVALVAKYK